MSDEAVAAGVRRLIRRITEEAGASAAGTHHALVVLLEEYGGIVRRLLPEEMNADEIKKNCAKKIAQGDIGAAINENLLESARESAKARGKKKVFEHDFIIAVLQSLGIEPKADAGWNVPLNQQSAQSSPAAAPLTNEEQTALEESSWQHRVKNPTPTLERLTRDLTQEAALGRLPPVVGRDAEVQAIMETLLRPTKRNPLLVGPAGVGKTAIIEGFAQLVVDGNVPTLLKNVRVFALQVADLTQGMGVVGALEKRINAIIKEAEQDGVILFLDEIHLAIGGGAGSQSRNDIANLLKPPLARGRMACIGATTDVEFNKYVTSDAAFARRFQPIRIQELSRDATLHILRARAEKAKARDGIVFDDEPMLHVVSLAERFIRNRYLPDKAIDIFDQAIARARIQNQEKVATSDVHDVMSRLIGLPVEGEAFSARIELLERRLIDEAGCDAESSAELARRLQVTMRGLDMEPLRPNAVLLAAEGDGDPMALCTVISESLFEHSDCTVVDLSTSTSPGEINRLTGAAPGYVGYDNPPAFHIAMLQRPWSVVLFYRPDLSHPVIQAALASMLRRGWVEDGAGRRIFLADAICVLVVAGVKDPGQRTMGFGAGDVTPPASEGPIAAWGIDPQLDAVIDIRVNLSPTSGPTASRVLEALLNPMAERWAEDVGVHVHWDGSVVDWLLEEAGGSKAPPGAISLLFENRVAPGVVQAIAAGGLSAVTVCMVDGQPVVTETAEA